jgi:protein-disulfide isomerase
VKENLTKAEKVAKAREDARQLRETLKKKEATKKLWIKILAVLIPVVVIIIVAMVIISGNKRTADATTIVQPANATEHGVIVGKNDAVVKADTATSTASATPDPSASSTAPSDPTSDPAKIVIYQDYICPACKSFESQSLQELKELRDSGKATVEYRFVTFLDDRSAGSNYSSRAANAAACVVNQNPDKFYAFNNALFDQQPAEGTKGLPNQKLIEIAQSVGVTGIDDCVKDGTYRGWTADANKTALDIPITGTPTILINDEKWEGKTSLTDAVAKK